MARYFVETPGMAPAMESLTPHSLWVQVHLENEALDWSKRCCDIVRLTTENKNKNLVTYQTENKNLKGLLEDVSGCGAINNRDHILSKQTPKGCCCDANRVESASQYFNYPTQISYCTFMLI